VRYYDTDGNPITMTEAHEIVRSGGEVEVRYTLSK